jgi:hypothetical protein
MSSDHSVYEERFHWRFERRQMFEYSIGTYSFQMYIARSPVSWRLKGWMMISRQSA